MDSNQVEIQLPGGRILAKRSNGLVHVRGLRYATASRFQRPTLTENWPSPFDCTKPAIICPQRPSRLNFITGDLKLDRQMDEDCLNLTITMPESGLEQSQKLPVLVWFHGGAYLSGGGDLDCYYPGSLASKGIIVVNVTYRLGIFGFMPVDGIAPSNLGLMDQLESLRWVSRNIQHFGGDPKQVTISGQSAGAHSAFLMTIVDDAKGLFRRVILQSPPFGEVYADNGVEQLSQYAKALIGTEPQSLTTHDLLEIEVKLIAEANHMGLPLAYWPHFGRYPMPDLSESESRVSDSAKTVPVLSGWTMNEGSAFVPVQYENSLWAKFPILGTVIKSVATWKFSGRLFVWPTQEYHRKYLACGGNSSTYSLDWSPAGSTHGAVHCIDLPFLFGSWDTWKAAPMLQGTGAKEVVERVGHQVRDLFAHFCIADDVCAFRSKHFDIDEDFVFEFASQ
ncbi:esterase [Aspergillus aculeatinus CBS 121060]|uniref:Esterase n=1 Tax=Aspergillus aculeatinus CBS 121060 TaxID=1448322 RepID=A0ACD1H4J1_9EURO|nr:esterase [Aspergillus aculeatinus CBS 121060]RAH68330.1 esterase [Aspergillus aculeatinus CBS 121060]